MPGPYAFTYRKYPKETGVRAIGYSLQSSDIKLQGRKVGVLRAPCWSTEDCKWSILFHISREPTTSDPCPFSNKILKNRFNTEADAKDFLKKRFKDILKLNLYQLEDDE